MAKKSSWINEHIEIFLEKFSWLSKKQITTIKSHLYQKNIRSHYEILKAADKLLENLKKTSIATTEIQNSFPNIISKKNFFENAYHEIILHYRKQFADGFFTNEINAYKESLIKLGYQKAFVSVRKTLPQPSTPDTEHHIKFIEEAEKIFQEEYGSVRLPDTNHLKALIATMDTILKSYTSNTKNIDAFILATITAFNSNGYINYIDIPTGNFLPLIPCRGTKINTTPLCFKLNDIEHPITNHVGTKNAYGDRMYIEDKLWSLLCLQKAINLDFFSKFENHENGFEVNLQDLLKNVDKEDDSTAASHIEGYILSFAHALKKKEKSYLFIDPKQTLDSLQKDGWHIKCTTDAKDEYNQSLSANNMKLESALINAIQKSCEFKLIHSDLNTNDKREVLKELLKQATKISITKNGAQGLLFQAGISPVYESVHNLIQNKLEHAFSGHWYSFSKTDLIHLLGKYAETPNDTVFKDSDAEFDAIKSCGLLHKKNDTYIFVNDFQKNIFFGEYYADKYDENYFDHDVTEDIPKKITDHILNFEHPTDKECDHRHINPISSVFFALAILNRINRRLRDQTLRTLCQSASNFDGKNREQQETAIKILTYFLIYGGHDISFELKKELFRTCFEQQLYPFQIPLYQELMTKDKFYSEFPKEAFAKSYNQKEDITKLTKVTPPSFYLLQGLCGARINKNITLAKAIDAQKKIWIEHLTEKQPKVKKLLNELASHIISAPYNHANLVNSIVIANNISFMTFANIAEQKRPNIQTFLDKIENKSIQPEDLLKAAIYTDYFQRAKNESYSAMLNNTQNTSQENIFLICGAFRIHNAYDFEKIKIKVKPEIIEYYHNKCFLYEQTTSRYFWFLWRLLSHVVDCDGNQIFTYEKITKIKEEDPKENYAGIHFLPYDNFPKTFDAFLKEIRLN